MREEIIPDILVETHFAGEDIIFIVTGGKAHIGAVATAYYEESDVSVSCKQLPHHKEGDLAEKMAKSAAIKLKVNVTVIVGIHINNATYTQILTLIDMAENKFEETLITEELSRGKRD